MWRKLSILLASFPLLLYTLIFAEEGWQTDIRVSLLDAENRLFIGQRPDATDEWNARYDIPAILAGDIMAYIEEPGGGKFWRKFRRYRQGYPDIKTWDVVVESHLEGQVIKLTWNSTKFPEQMVALLIDTDAGNEINMKAQSEYSYENSGKRKFQVEVQH